jgi:hypothetical protein
MKKCIESLSLHRFRLASKAFRPGCGKGLISSAPILAVASDSLSVIGHVPNDVDGIADAPLGSRGMLPIYQAWEMEMPNGSIIDYRKRADECRQRAEASTDTTDKDRWLVFAEQWLKLADEENRSNPASITEQSING